MSEELHYTYRPSENSIDEVTNSGDVYHTFLREECSVSIVMKDIKATKRIKEDRCEIIEVSGDSSFANPVCLLEDQYLRPQSEIRTKLELTCSKNSTVTKPEIVGAVRNSEVSVKVSFPYDFWFDKFATISKEHTEIVVKIKVMLFLNYTNNSIIIVPNEDFPRSIFEELELSN